METLERVAKAIYQAEAVDLKGDGWDGCEQEEYRVMARAALAALQQEESYRCPQGHTAKLTEVGSYQECPCGQPWGSHEVVAADPHKQEPGGTAEAERIERKEIEGEWLAELAKKGYTLKWHRESEPCFSCSLSSVIRELPPSGESAPLTLEAYRTLIEDWLSSAGESVLAPAEIDGLATHLASMPASPAPLTPEEARTAATLVDMMKNDLPPHISESEQVAAYLALRALASTAGQEDG